MNDIADKNKTLLEDRLLLKQSVDNELLKFIKLQLDKTTNENSLKVSVLNKIQERLNNNETPIDDVNLIRLLEALAKQDNEIVLGFMNIIKAKVDASAKSGEEANIQFNFGEEKSSFSKEDVHIIKDLLQTLDKVKKSEF
jgi:hypothetical protein